VGVDCDKEYAITLANVPVVTGYYRRSADQIDVRRCPDAAANCPGGQSVCENSTSACAGILSPGQIPAPGQIPGEVCRCLNGVCLNGTFCRTCTEPDTYYVKAKKGVYAHCESCDNLVSNGLNEAVGILLVVVGSIVFIGLLLALFCRGNVWQRFVRTCRAMMIRFALLTTAKILVGFYMIATKIEDVYEVMLPAEVRALLQELRIVISLGFEGVPLVCAGIGGYLNRLVFWMCMPPVALIIIALVVFVINCSRGKFFGGVKLTPFLLYVAFLYGASQPRTAKRASTALIVARVAVSPASSYPIITNVAFEAFSCFEFEDGTGWLIADVLIQCDTAGFPSPEHLEAKAIATLAICIYPVGVWVLHAMLLFFARKDIRSKKTTKLSSSLTFIHKDYDPAFFWWEVC
jgi:hypothetical protein